MAEVQYAPESAHAKELARWNRPKNQYVDGLPGFGAVGYEPFPKMLYKAQKRADGKIECMIAEPAPYGWARMDLYASACDEVIAFNRSCQTIVNDEREMNRAKDQGFRETPAEAVAYAKRFEDDISKAAAERHFSDAKMSEKAQAEAKAADDATEHHLPEIPRTKRKYVRKVQPV